MNEHADRLHVLITDEASLDEIERLLALHSGAHISSGHGRIWRRQNYQEDSFHIECVVGDDRASVRITEGDPPEDLAELDDGLPWGDVRRFLRELDDVWKLELTVTLLKPEAERGEVFCYTLEGLELAAERVAAFSADERGPPDRLMLRTPLVSRAFGGERIVITPISSKERPKPAGPFLVPIDCPPELRAPLASIQTEIVFGWILGKGERPALDVQDARRLAEAVQAHRLMAVVGRRVLPEFDWTQPTAVDAAIHQMTTMEEMLVAQAANELRSDIEGLRASSAEFIRDLQKAKTEILGGLNTDLFKIVTATLVMALGLPYVAIADYRTSLWLALAAGGIFLLGAAMKSWSLTADFNRLYGLRAALARRTAARALPDIREIIVETARDLRESYYKTLVIGIGANALPVMVILGLISVEYGFAPIGRILASCLATALVAAGVLFLIRLRPWRGTNTVL